MCIIYKSTRCSPYNMEKLVEEFDKLMIDFLAGSLSENDSRKFYELLNSDRLYQKRYGELAKIYATSFVPRFEARKKKNYADLVRQLDIRHTVKSSRFFSFSNFSRITAVLLLSLTTTVSAYYLYQDIVGAARTDTLCEMEVPLGSQTKIVLPDGSVVCLNSGTTLKYDPLSMNRKTREVYLAGEGYFEIRKNPDKPFIVHTGGIRVEVLGTVFNVKAYSDDYKAEVTLIEGKVQVASSVRPADTRILYPDECLVWDKKTQSMRTRRVNAVQSALWTTGRLNFVNARLTDILNDIERKYNVRITVKSKRMEKEIFTGSISTALTLDEILEYIDVDHKYRWQRNGNLITVTDK